MEEVLALYTRWQPLINLLIGIPIAIVTAKLTTSLAMSKFRSERWFERKLDAYTAVIQSMHTTHRVLRRELNAMQTGIDLSEEAHQTMFAESSAASKERRRLTAMGALLFSDAANAVLMRLNAKLEASKEDPWHHQLQTNEQLFEKSITEFVMIAKRDLPS